MLVADGSPQQEQQFGNAKKSSLGVLEMGAAVVVLFLAFEFLTFFQPSNDSRFLGFKRLSPISPQANPARRAVVKVNIRL